MLEETGCLHSGLSAGARTGLTAAAKVLSREVAEFNVTNNNLLPEAVEIYIKLADRVPELGTGRLVLIARSMIGARMKTAWTETSAR